MTQSITIIQVFSTFPYISFKFKIQMVTQYVWLPVTENKNCEKTGRIVVLFGLKMDGNHTDK